MDIHPDAENIGDIEVGEVTQFLQALRSDGAETSEELIARIHSELKRLASYQLRGERPDHTLQPTALVNEAYLRLVDYDRWTSRGHFYRVAAKVMRQILVDHARARKAQKRGGHDIVMQLSAAQPEPVAHEPRSADDLLALDEALSELAKRDPRQALIVELRYFSGLNEQDVCQVLSIAPRTVRRDWQSARAWLYGRLKRRQSGEE